MRLGVCLDDRSLPSFWRLDALGATAVSVTLAPEGARTQQLSALAAVRRSGRDVLGVIEAASFSSPLDWRATLDGVLDYLGELVVHQLVTHVAVGREWDDGIRPYPDPGGPLVDDPLVFARGGYGSWVLSAADLSELVGRVSDRLGSVRAAPLLLGGMCSGQASVLKTLDLSQVDGILIHPYGSGEDAAGDDALNQHLDAVRAEIDAQGRSGQVSLLIGELGRSDAEVPRAEIAAWFTRTLRLLDARGDIDAVFIYADSDRWALSYGQFDLMDRPKPSVLSISGVAADLAVGGPLVASPPWPDELGELDDDPDAEGPEEPELPRPPHDPRFTPAGIARALTGQDDPQLAQAVDALWEQLYPWLEHYGLGESVSAKIALLAAIWVQTDGRLVPHEEDGYDRSERRYGRDSLGGALLGNRYHGDGYRYRGRGLVPIRGRATYTHQGLLLDLPLERLPGMVMDPEVAAAATVLLFVQRELFPAAERGDWFAVWAGIEPGRHGYQAFARAVYQLWAYAIGDAGDPLGEDEAMWQERYEAAIEEAERLAETLYVQQRKLEALGKPPLIPSEKDTKKVWVESGQATRRWQDHAVAVTRESADMLGGMADALIAIGLTEGATDDGQEERKQQAEAEGDSGQEDDREEAVR